MDRRAEEKIRSLAAEVAGDYSFELFDVTIFGRGRRSLVRVSIDKEGGVTLDDCETFSRKLEALMDIEDPIAGPYTLEVSSPGLDRPLKGINDFRKNIGRLIRIVTMETIDSQSFFMGRLEGVNDDSIRLSLSQGRREIVIPFRSISRAKLEIELK